MIRPQVLAAAALLGCSFLASSIVHASAVTATCSGEYTAANGTETSPFTDIGTVQSGCEIGPFVADIGGGTNLSGTPASVGGSPKPNPSIYQFEWGGGTLTIGEMLGNNGTGNSIFVEVGLASNGVSSNNASLNSPLASISISGGNAPPTYFTLTNLAAGTYLLDNFLDNSGALVDPNYAVGFNISATPLPATLPLFAGGLGFVGYLSGRRKRSGNRALSAS
jgi:hypothetical protein